MPRNRPRTIERTYWMKEDLLLAIDNVRVEEYILRAASFKFNIHYSIFKERMKKGKIYNLKMVYIAIFTVKRRKNVT